MDNFEIGQDEETDEFAGYSGSQAQRQQEQAVQALDKVKAQQKQKTS